MKKNGLTLAELLITLSIVGIVAAVSFPAINHFTPNKSKINYLKALDSLSEAIQLISANSRLYPACYTNDTYPDGIVCTKYPFLNTSQPTIAPFDQEKFSGNTKLCSLIGYAMGVAYNDLSCSGTKYDYDKDSFVTTFNNNISFTTSNGMRWMLRPQVDTTINDATNRATFELDVYVDINPENENADSCIECEKPDIFKFIITADGNITTGDLIGRTYLNSRKSWLKSSQNADNVILNDTIANRTFTYEPCVDN